MSALFPPLIRAACPTPVFHGRRFIRAFPAAAAGNAPFGRDADEYVLNSFSVYSQILANAKPDLRGTAAFQAFEQNGVDIKTVSVIPGRCGAGFTLRACTHTTDRQQEQAAEMLGSLVAQSL